MVDTDVRIISDFAEFWGFKYNLTRSQKDFNNLLDSSFNGFYLFQAQGKLNPKSSQTGFTLDHEFSGSIYVCTPSDIAGVLSYYDENEQIKFDKYLNVEKAYQIQPWRLLNQFECPNEFELVLSNVRPFYNVFDINYDGVVIDYVFKFKNQSQDLSEQKIRDLIQNVGNE